MNLKFIYLLPFLVVWMTSSCNSDVADDVDLSRRAEMSFDVQDFSRGSVTKSIDKFFVYGDMKSTSGEFSNPIGLFNRKMVEYIDGDWCYDDIQYWCPKYEHSFIAVAPESLFENSRDIQYSNSQLRFTYSIPAPGGNLSGNSDISDILIATHRRYFDYSGPDSTPYNRIAFTFSHILSLINLAPAFSDNMLSRDSYLLFHQMELSGIKTEARFNIMPAPRQSGNQTDDMAIDIVPARETGNITITFAEPLKVKNNEINVSLFADDDALIMLPQEFDADSGAKIIFSYSINEDTSIKQVSLPLDDQKWESGRNHVYKFIIDRKGLKLDKCEINHWNEIRGDDITVD